MIFKHNTKFLESPTMRLLEIHAVQKGIIKPSPIVKEAETKSLEPGENLLSDLFKLADGLREKGFVKDAEGLEDKILNYKLAETHLYKAFDEEGSDLIGFAHPSKAVVIDAKDNEGLVENLLERHEKMLNIVNKTPTGKLALVLDETAGILGIKKKSQLNNSGEILTTSKGIADNYTDLSTTQADFFKFLNELSPSKFFVNVGQILAFGNKGVLTDKAIQLVRAGVDKPEIVAEGAGKSALKFYLDSNNITSTQWAKFLNNDPDFQFDRIFSKENLNNANSQIQQVLENLFYSKLRNLNIGAIVDLNDQKSVQESLGQINSYIATIKSLFDEYSGFTFKVLTNMDVKIENKIRNNYIPQLLKSANIIKTFLENKIPKPETKTEDKSKWNWMVNNVAAKFSRLFDVAQNHPTRYEFGQIFSALKVSGINKDINSLKEALSKIDPAFQKINGLEDLDRIAMNWENYFKENKVANLKHNLEKRGQSVVLQGPPKPANKPPAANQGRATKSRATNSFEQTRPNEFKSVVLMQQSLQTLAQNLDGKIKESAKLTDQQVKEFKLALTGTGWARETRSKYETPVDGRWGNNTSQALNVAQKILNVLKTKNLIEGDTTITTERQFSAGKSDEEVAKLAQNNLSKINIALQVAKVPVPNKSTTNYYDKLPQVKIPEDTNAINTPENEGKFGIGPTDLKTFTNLHNYLTNHDLTEDDTNKEEISAGFTADKWDKILKWFNSRAAGQKENAPDNAIKDKYIQDVSKLWNKFVSKINELAKKQNAPVKRSQIITPYDLDGSSPEAASTGRVQNKTDSAAEGQNYEFVPEKSNNLLAQPIGYYINSLWELKENYPNAMTNWNVYDKLLKIKAQLNVEDFEADPKFFMNQYIKPLTWSDILDLNPQINRNQKVVIPNKAGGQQVTNYTYEQLGNLYPNSPLAISLANQARMKGLTMVIRALYTDLQNVVGEWQRLAYDKKVPAEAIRATNTAWKRWSGALYSLIEGSSRYLRNSNVSTHSETTFM